MDSGCGVCYKLTFVFQKHSLLLASNSNAPCSLLSRNIRGKNSHRKNLNVSESFRNCEKLFCAVSQKIECFYKVMWTPPRKPLLRGRLVSPENIIFEKTIKNETFQIFSDFRTTKLRKSRNSNKKRSRTWCFQSKGCRNQWFWQNKNGFLSRAWQKNLNLYFLLWFLKF